MDARDMFVDAVTKDLLGRPAPVAERAEPSAKDELVRAAISDLNVPGMSAEKLAEKFKPQVPVEPAVDSAKIIERFNEEAQQETKGVLAKLLKGLK